MAKNNELENGDKVTGKIGSPANEIPELAVSSVSTSKLRNKRPWKSLSKRKCLLIAAVLLIAVVVFKK